MFLFLFFLSSTRASLLESMDYYIRPTVCNIISCSKSLWYVKWKYSIWTLGIKSRTGIRDVLLWRWSINWTCFPLSIIIDFLCINFRKCRKQWTTLRNALLSWKVKLKTHQSSLLCLRWIGSPRYCTTTQGLSRWENVTVIHTYFMPVRYSQFSPQQSPCRDRRKWLLWRSGHYGKIGDVIWQIVCNTYHLKL